jgi:hypothetical protein
MLGGEFEIECGGGPFKAGPGHVCAFAQEFAASFSKPV